MGTRHTVQLLAGLLIAHLSITSLIATTNLPKAQTSALEDNFYFHKQNLSCEYWTQTNGKKKTAYCPNQDKKIVEIEITFGESVVVHCHKAGVQLTDLEVDVGNVKGFGSRKCNLANKLGEIFLKWNITGVENLDIQNFVGEDVLRKKTFDNIDVSQIKSIDIYDSNITEVEENTFQDFFRLERISLRSNKITNFPDFTSLKKIRVIDMSLNRLTVLPDELNLPSLQLLSLWNNNLTTLSESCFRNMSTLAALEMRNNQIKYLPEKILHPLTGLKEVSLTGLIEIPSGLFKMNPALEKIVFSSINLTSIPEDIFWTLSNLMTLMLTETSLETLPVNLLANQTNLRKLHLYNNRLKTLPRDVFRNLQNLESLQIYGNQLEEWNSPTKRLPKLRELLLSSNKLTKIKADFSNSILNLRNLDLRSNNISHISSGAFNFEGELDDLNLSHNNLTDDLDEITFVNQMRRVVRINLAYNAYESFPEGIELKTFRLNMAYNKIKTLDLSYVMNFKESNFSHNAIETITFGPLSQILQALASETLEKSRIDISDNPFNCNCSMFELARYFDGTYRNKDIYSRISLDGTIRCHGPSNLAGRDVRSLISQTFTCDYNHFYVCPEKCSCEMYPYYQSFNVTCSNRHLSIPPIVPEFGTHYGPMFTINKLVIDLSNNSIKNFTKRDSSYVNASELNLSANELDLVDWLPPQLEVLRLNDNKLGNLGYNAILAVNGSKHLSLLTLHDNLWNCNCKLLNFTKLVKDQHWKIPFEDKVSCTDNRKVVGLVEGNICGFENQAALIAIGACFFTFLILIGLILIFYYKYEYHIKVWLYSKPILMRFVTEEELDKDKTYDAFISFSHKDDEFVAKQLVHVLEDGPNPYKLCIHSRDWIVGEFINRQIINSVQNSRRTIIVLSPDFLESEWATIEFRTAHTEAMKEGRNRVIVILYGDIDPKTVKDEDLRIYLSTNTYVKWGDPWFWKKLKYVLPHKNDERNNNVKRNSGRKLKNKKMENIMVTIDKMDLINSPATPNVGTPPAISLDPLLMKDKGLPYNSNSDAQTPPAEAGLVTASS